jgi:hypothetical protein
MIVVVTIFFSIGVTKNPILFIIGNSLFRLLEFAACFSMLMVLTVKRSSSQGSSSPESRSELSKGNSFRPPITDDTSPRPSVKEDNKSDSESARDQEVPQIDVAELELTITSETA